MKTLPSLRVKEQTLANVEGAIKLYNKNSLMKLTTQEFRRLALEYFAQLILKKEPIDLELLRE